MSGYLGNSRVVIDHYDVSTQADIQHTAVSYESEDEAFGRLFGRSRRGTPSYSKQDILEQYCISDRGLGALEQDRRSLFSCLSMQQASPCSNRTSLLTVCVRQKVPSDENLQDIVRRYPTGYDPYYKRLRYPWNGSQPSSDIYPYNEESDCSYFRKRSRIDPRKYTWMPSDDESVRLERPRSLLDQYNPATLPPPPPPAITRPKHVSFARSHTMTSFDDTSVPFVNSPYQNVRMSRSQERLLGLRRSIDPLPPITRQPTPSDNVAILEKLKRVPASMKSQATQTEGSLGRKPILPGQVHFNPWPLNRANMVSQAAQTNGILINGRKLMKSYSEVGGGRFNTICKDTFQKEPFVTHDPLCRTQSDEPPRSPFVVTSPPHLTKEIRKEESPQHSHQVQVAHESETSDESESNLQEEIIIDFEPRFSSSSPIEIVPKKTLQKTLSEGEILLDQRRLIKEEILQTKTVSSLSHENLKDQSDSDGFVPYFRNSPIRNEGVFRKLQGSVYSSISDTCEGIGLPTQDSVEEEFHETLIYKGRYLRRSGSSTSDDILEDRCNRKPERLLSLEDESVVPVFERKPSPFTSNDSLANDVRDHSDGIWNESQVTVLQVDSGTENGTGLSSSEITSQSAPAATTSITLLTPSTRRKNLLLQHLQRSSMDIDALDEEAIETTKTQPELPNICKESAQHISPKKSEYKNQQFLTAHPIHKQPPPLTKKRPVEQKPESPLPAVVPELPLARTDSGKTNTDISESTTTTDDYITATSGTDSSKKSSNREAAVKLRSSAVVHDGSSFESASSIYGQAKSDVFGDDMVVPSFSPPLILEETCTELKVVVCSRGGSAPEPSSPSPSSSSGSYSLDGSCSATSPQKPAVPSSRRVPSVSEDERSARYSSSGYYESPLDDEPTWKPDRLGCVSDEKNQKKKKITIDSAKHQKWEEKPSTSDKQKSSSKQTKKTDDEQPFTKDLLKVNGKVKRTRTRTRSPLQSQKRSQQSRRSPSSLKTSPLTDQPGFEKSNHEKKFSVTSDDSSSGLCGEKVPSGQASPRKREKKVRDVGRKKSISRSPVGSKTRRKENEKPSSLPGSLPRRKSVVQVSSSEKNLNSSKTTLSPRSVSPADSPTSKRRLSHSKTSPETTRLKALSAESLRSVSPGSDSVFYSDPSSQAAAAEHQVHCLHCGKEVDIVTTDDPDRRSSRSGSQADIVQPPAGFADSPRSKHVSGKLYKKFEKRFRSEERQAERRHHRHRFDARAKSEERAGKSEDSKVKLRPMARSTDASLEGLRAADSSPSILPGAPENEEDLGLYNVPYSRGCWIFINDHEELNTWTKQEVPSPEGDSPTKESFSSTESEQEFKKKYQFLTHRMVHRKSCLEMYKRQTSNSFAPESTTGEHETLRRSLEELLKLMLVVWCKENQAIKMVSAASNETDKTIVVRRKSGEFGFRIHGSKPVVVSAIEPDTPAESSGLEVGDIVLAVNGISVLDKSHSEVVKIAHAGSDVLTLEVARTSGVLSPSSADVHGGEPLYCGYLWKLGGYASGAPSKKWVRRWFTLKKDNCLYYYKTDVDKQPVGAMMLMGYEIIRSDDSSSQQPFQIDLRKPGVPTLHIAADTETAAARWLEVLHAAAEKSQMADTWLEQTRRNLTVAPDEIPKPDCFGYLIKLGSQWKSWSRRYCVLKDACLYFYHDANAKSAFGVACLHGYRVQPSASGSKKHGFEIIPSDSSQKHFYFYTECDIDRKRWVAALEYSIDRWLKVG